MSGMMRSALEWCARALDKDHPAAIAAREALAEQQGTDEERSHLAGDYLALKTATNWLLDQIDRGDFVDSHGHSAKMLKPAHDLMHMLARMGANSSPAPPAPAVPDDTEIERLRAALLRLEAACDTRARLLTPFAYHAADAIPGMREANYELDNARKAARLAAAPGVNRG